MLYLNTRNKADSFTAHKVLHTKTLADGGLFVPMNLPTLDDISLASFERMGFGEAAACIFNLFFGTKLSGWDVDFAVGRQTLDLVSAGYKVCLAESWHNPAGSHEYLVQKLHQLVTGERCAAQDVNMWFRTTVDIAILFAVYGKYCRQEIYEFDIAVETGDLQQLLAVRCAQKMGLPIRKIILGSIDGDGVWEFFSHGGYQRNRKYSPVGLEALLWLEFGYGEAAEYASSMDRRSIYKLNDVRLAMFKHGVFATVVGDNRAANIVESTIRTNNYQMELSTARAFAALQDYRAKTGENKNTLLFARNMPVK